MNTSNVLRKVAWKIALPTIILLATLALLHLDQVWFKKTIGVDDMPVTSAWGFVCVLNWPGLFLTFWLRWLPDTPIFGGYLSFDVVRLAASLTFWTYAGWLLDRRIAGNINPLVRSRPIRTGLFLLGLSVSLYALVAGGLEVRGWLHHLGWYLRSRWIYLMGRELNSLAAAVWGFLGTYYFAKKLFLPRSTTPANTSYTSAPQSR